MEKSKSRILIVDDERFFINILVNLLKPEYQTLIALTGEQAMERTLSNSPPDLILLDIVMPGMDGFEVCRQLKQGQKSRDIPIIFLTAKSEVDDETKGFQLGAVDYITKPISPPIVKARVNTHLTLQRTREELKQYNRQLENIVDERTQVQNPETVDRKVAVEPEFRLAKYDQLTLLPNRILLREQLIQQMKHARRDNTGLAVLIIELCHYENINQSLGHVLCDDLLKQMSVRLSHCARESDIVGCVDTNKFLIAVLDVKDKSAVKLVAEKIAARLMEPYQVEDANFVASVRIGISQFPEHTDNADILLLNAEAAMFRAKESTNKNIEYYSAD